MAEMVQIDKDQLAILQKADAFLGTLLNDSDVGEAIQVKAKKVFPNARFAADAAEPFVAPLKKQIEQEREARTKLQERLDARDKTELEAKETADLEGSLDRARKTYKLTDEGMEKVYKRMRAMNNPDAESAAAWVTDNEPRPAPTPASSYTPQSLNLIGAGEKSDDPDTQLLHRDPLKFFDMETAKILAEPAEAA